MNETRTKMRQARRWLRHLPMLLTAVFVIPVLFQWGDSDSAADKPPRHPWFDAAESFVAVSHEGIKEGPEIALDGFVEARRLGYIYMETDLRRTVTDQLVAKHLVRNRLDGKLPDGEAPLASELLSHPDLDGVRWNFEISNPDDATRDAFVELLEESGAADRICVSFGRNVSLGDRTISSFRAALPSGMCTCAGFGERAADIDSRILRLLTKPFRSPDPSGAACAVVSNWSADRKDVAQADDVVLLVWPSVRETRTSIERHIDDGFDGIMTNEPELLRKILQERGLWTDPDE